MGRDLLTTEKKEKDIFTQAKPQASAEQIITLNESFDGTTFPPTGWDTLNFEGDGVVWSRVTNITRTGAGAAFTNQGGVADRANEWLITPRIRAYPFDTLFYWYRAVNNANNETLQIRLSKASNKFDTTQYSIFADIVTANNNNNYYQDTVPLSMIASVAGESVYIAIQHKRLGSRPRGIRIDDVVIRSYPVYIIVSSAGPGGTISPLDTSYVSEGDSLRFTITPDPGYTVDSLIVDGTPITPALYYTFYNVDANHTIRVTFISAYTITFDQTGIASDYTGPIVNVDGTDYYYSDLPKSFNWLNGSSHNFQYYDTLTTTGKRYIWTSTTGLSTTKSGTIVVSGNGTVTRNYKTQYELTMATNYGTTSPSVGTHWYDAGTVVPISATAPVPGVGEQYLFNGWTGTGTISYTGTNNPDQVTMNSPITQTASWTLQYYLTVTSPYGTPGGEGWYNAGATAYATVTPLTVAGPAGTQYVFTNWSVDATGTTSPSDPITMSGPKTATAVWKTQYELTMATNYGTTSPAVGTHWYNAGTVVPISATAPVANPGEQYLFNGWTGTGTISYTGTNNPDQVTMNSPITQTASWTLQYQLTIATN